MTAAKHEAAILRLLADLGATPDAVADTLRAKGIKGERDDSCLCPIANLLRAHGVADPEVGQHGIFLDAKTAFDTPPAIRAFIQRFDLGVYLDLVEAS